MPESSPDASRRIVALAAAASVVGLIVHNLAEFPLSILLSGVTLVPLGVTVLLAAWLLRSPSRVAFLVTAGWTLLVLVVGGGGVLPLAIWPFTPEQSLSHYGAHVVYALGQLPFLWVAIDGLRDT